MSKESYFKYRCRELPIWLGIPLIGFFFGSRVVSCNDFVIFLLAATFFMAHILLLNDWGGLLRNPNEGNRYDQRLPSKYFNMFLLRSSLMSFVVSLLLFLTIKPVLVVLIIVGGCLSFLYSSSAVHWKANPILSKLLHLCGGIIKFLLGFLVNSPDLGRGIFIGLFFAVIFIAGNLIHECIDQKDDLNGLLKTAAVRWGTRPLVQISWYVFIFAHTYWFVLASSGIITFADAAIFSAPVIVHVLAKIKMEYARDHLLRYRVMYRAAYAFSAVVFILKQILFYRY